MSGIVLGGEHDFPRRFAALETLVRQLAMQGLLLNGQLTSAGTLYLQAAAGSGGSVVLNPDSGGTAQVNGNLAVTGNQTVSGTKSFLMDHPTDPTKSLQHAATESPENGVEYWGSGILDATGQLVVTLPDYFDALTTGTSPVVLVTPQWVAPVAPATYSPPALAASAVQAGAFTVYGPAGTPFSWLVKAARVHMVNGVDTLAFAPVQPKVIPVPAEPTTAF